MTKSLIIFLKSYKFIFLFIIFALLIRLVNIGFGYPILYVIPDEVPNYLSAFEMIASRRITSFSHYPPLGSYIQLPFFILSYLFMRLFSGIDSILTFQQFITTHEGAFLFIPRTISALFNVATIVIVYKMARYLFPRKREIAVWSILLFGLSLTNLQFSHIGKPWTPAVFLTTLGIYYFLRSFDGKGVWKRKKLVISSLSFALASGFHFSSLITFFFFASVGFFLIIKQKGKFQELFFYFTIFLLFPLFFVLFYKLVKINSFIPHQEESFSQIRYYWENGILKGCFWYFKEFLLTEPVTWISFILGFILIKWPAKIKLLFCYVIVYFSVFAFGYFQSLHYLLPVFPIISLISGYTIFTFINNIKRLVVKNLLIMLIYFILIIPVFIWLNLYSEKPTFILVRDWIERSIPPDVKIAYFQVRFAAFSPASDSIKIIQSRNPLLYKRQSESLTASSYPDNVREVIFLEQLININDPLEVKDFLDKNDIQYLIYYYWDPYKRDFYPEEPLFRSVYLFSPFKEIDIKDPPQAYNLIHNTSNIMELIKMNRLGPYMEVVKVSK